MPGGDHGCGGRGSNDGIDGDSERENYHESGRTGKYRGRAEEMTGPVTKEVVGAMTSAVTQTMTKRIDEMTETMENTVAVDSGTCCQDEVADAMLEAVKETTKTVDEMTGTLMEALGMPVTRGV